MAYLGAGLDAVNETLATINMVCDTMTGNGSITTKVLSSSKSPGSVNNVSVYYDGVAQTPTTDYTLSNSTITFTTAPENNVNVVILSYANEFDNMLSDKTVYASGIEDGAITNDLISGISSSKLTGALPSLDGSALTGVVPIDPVLLNEAGNPTVSSMIATGNGVGTLWVNSTTGNMFVCTDATVGANVWTNIGGGSGNVEKQFMSATNTNGTEVNDPSDADYKIVTFNTSGSFTPSIGTNATHGNKVEYLVIAGGGGGGGSIAGGGGAGGYLTASGFTVTSTEITVTVGGGGLGGTNSPVVNGINGQNSVFGSITSTGGGGGGTIGNTGSNGGSGGGGGGAGNLIAPGTGIAGQGFGGGIGRCCPGDTFSGGGGGGAGAVGQSSNPAGNNVPPNGGAGLSSSITGTAVFRAGGGGGGWHSGAPGGASGAGGNGGGGAGVSVGNGVAGTINTGSGGGGGQVTSGLGGAGGSGIVIIRYKFR
tara:strand:+ start:2573 stop:4015 length:1443 start_codon:yes stop_codon:yes gene_type:complete